jgi:hypothetical protein
MQRYETNPNVIHETIDGETIIIDLATGTYHSLLGAGPAIWDEITAGSTTATVVERAVQQFDAEPAAVKHAVEAFVQQLEEAQLIAPTEAAAAEVDRRSAPAASKLPFVAPKLETYTDMQDIILLDPVHKVDSRGWPHAADTPAG